MNLKLYNTISQKIEDFTIKNPNSEVKLYCCGPTVYSYPHIGNLRTYLFEDILVRTLIFNGLKVKHVMNITDVGHLVSDGDTGEDKMLLAVKKEGKKSEEIANFYTEIFFRNCEALNIIRPEIVCKATDHIQEMIKLIQKLEILGASYQAGGNIYFDITKCDHYGKLAKLDLDSLFAGARIEIDSHKKNPLDFALWFTRSKFENQDLQWDSPWGRGYPGWHLECSAMALKYLGEELDIHCGGIDHIPVHHTNEIAQSETATKKPFSRFWMHGGFLVQAHGKMSKSKGEFLTLDLLIAKGFNPLSYRYLCLTATYRSELSWSWEALENAENSYKSLLARIARLKLKTSETENDNINIEDPEIKKYLELFKDSLNEDLSMPRALAVLYKLLDEKLLSTSDKIGIIKRLDLVLGLNLVAIVINDEKYDQAVHLAKLRMDARLQKNYSRSDELRNQIDQLGYNVEDNNTSFKIVKKL